MYGLHYCFKKKAHILVKSAIFYKKMVIKANLRGPWYWYTYFLNLNIIVYFRATFQISSNILTSFRQGVILPLTEKKPMKYPPRFLHKHKSKFFTENLSNKVFTRFFIVLIKVRCVTIFQKTGACIPTMLAFGLSTFQKVLIGKII